VASVFTAPYSGRHAKITEWAKQKVGQSEVASSWSASVSSDFMALYKCCYY